MKYAEIRCATFLLLSCFMLTACDVDESVSQSDPSDNDVNMVTLDMVQTFTRQDEVTRLTLLHKQIQQLEDENPEIDFQLSAVEEKVFRDEKLPTAMTVGDPPDIFDLFGGSDTKRYAEAGRLLDLTDFLDESGLKDKFVGGTLDEFTVNGRIYGLPRAGYAEGFFYNKAIFKEIGATIPKTWDDLEGVVEQAKAAGYTPIAMGSKQAWVPGMILNAIIIRNVGMDNFRGLMTGDYKWTNPQMVKAWGDFKRLIDIGAFPEETLGINYAEQSNIFGHGKAAMVYTGSWDALIFTSKDARNLNEHLGFFMFPTIPGGKGDQTSINAGYSNGWGFYADVNSAQEEAIHKFIKLTWSEHEQKEQLIKAKVLPTIKLDDSSGIEPVMENILEVMDNATSHWPAYDAIFNKSVQNKFNDEIQKVIGEVDSPEQALEHIQKVTDKQIQSKKDAES